MKEAAIGVIFNEGQDRILLIKRYDIPIWVLPGGGIEEGEQPEEAVVREIREETGVEVALIRKVAEYSAKNRLGSSVHLFQLTVTANSPATSVEAKEVGFYPINQLPSPFFSLHEKWIQDALKEEPQIIKAPLDITYTSALVYGLRHPWLAIRWLLVRMGFAINR